MPLIPDDRCRNSLTLLIDFRAGNFIPVQKKILLTGLRRKFVLAPSLIVSSLQTDLAAFSRASLMDEAFFEVVTSITRRYFAIKA